MEEKRTSSEWEKLVSKKHQLRILDHDGWDRKNFDYSFNIEKITKQEFLNRVSRSTIQCNRTFFDE